MLQVERLVRLLASLFPRRMGDGPEGEGTERVAPYHKSVVDWLTRSSGMDAGADLAVDPVRGHLLLARASVAAVGQPKQQGQGQQWRGFEAYALRHGVAHACQAGDADVLHDLLLGDFRSELPSCLPVS
jgi:hypothetical protein